MSIKKAIDHEGNEFPSVEAMCIHWNIPKKTYESRIRRGWTKGDALTIPVGSKNSGYKTITDHEGNKYSSVEAMCKYWGVTRKVYESRIRNGWLMKEALTTQVKSNFKTIIDHEGNEYPSTTAMCEHWGISRDIYKNRIKLGWPLKDALATPVGSKHSKYKAVLDHEGNKFLSENAMCRHWKISKTTYNDRIKRGWSKKDALTIQVGSKTSKRITDHEGNEFSSIKEMCKYWNIPYSAYSNRIKQNWSINDILTTPIGYEITDHKGNEFSSVEAMCKYWGIPRNAYEGRIRRDWSLKDALTIPIGAESAVFKSVTDHEGNKFPSIAAMCRHWNITDRTYRNRINLGWSLKDTLTIPMGTKNARYKLVTDHEGNIFSSITAMCEHWGITRSLYKSRLKLGWSKKDILTIPVGTINLNSKAITDHKGNKFPSMNAMYQYWNITKAAYQGRIKLGWSQKKALTTIPKNTDICDGYTVLYQIDYCEDEGDEVNFYMCSIKGIGGPILRAFEDIFNDILQLRETGHIDWIDLIRERNKKDEQKSNRP